MLVALTQACSGAVDMGSGIKDALKFVSNGDIVRSDRHVWGVTRLTYMLFRCRPVSHFTFISYLGHQA